MLSLKETYLRMVDKGFFENAKKRECLKRVLEEIEEQVLKSSPTLTLVQLPPGYGKTAIPYSLSLWALSSDDVYLERSIHVLPLRSIVENSWRNFKKGLERIGLLNPEKISGAQCMFVHGSPFLQKNLAITTIDTFSLLMAKLPPSEMRKIAQGKLLGRYKSLGHYEVGRGALFSSTVVFDEVHLFIGEGKRGRVKSLTALLALILALLKWRVPVVLMTATLPSTWAMWIRKWFEERERGLSVKSLTYGEKGLRDEEFEREVRSSKILTKISSFDEKVYVKEVAESAESYERVLVVTNTVERAQKLYEELRDLRPLLLHAKFTQGDRERRIEKIGGEKGRRGKWFCISTQVIEAGVDLSAQALFTDIAPLCSLVQRSGRCCRPPLEVFEEGRLTICTNDDAFFEASKVYDEDILKRTKEVVEKLDKDYNWHSYFDYMKLLEEAYKGLGELEEKVSFSLLKEMLTLLLDPYWESLDALRLLLELGSFTRDEPLITGVVCENREGPNDLESLKDNLIPLEFSDVLKIAKRSHKVELLTRDGKKELRKVNKGVLYEKMLFGDVIGVRIPPELYDSERGLLV